MPISIRHPVIVGLTLGLGVGLSIVAALLVKRWDTSSQQVRFQRQIENLTTALQRSLNRYTDVLAFLGDYYAVTPDPIGPAEFAAFAARSLQTYPGIQALEWAPLVPQAERLRFEQTLHTQGYPTFQITELSPDHRLIRAGDRPYYVPVTYVVPLAGNEAALGFDLNSNAARAVAIASARTQGTITATGRVRLVQEQRDQFGFLVLLPLYAPPSGSGDGVERTAEGFTRQPVSPSRHAIAQRGPFEGFLVGVFRVSDVVEESLQGLRFDAVNFVIHDQSASPDQQFLGRYDATRQQVTTEQGDRLSPSHHHAFLCPTPAACRRTLTVGQRQWQVRFSPADGYAIPPAYGVPITLLVGLLLTASLVISLHSLNRELERTKHLSELKVRFFSMASHELRTPLSTILLSAESLQLNQTTWAEAQKQSNIQRIHHTAQRMSQQITDLLTLTRAEVGKLEFNPAMVDIVPFCQHLVDELAAGTVQRIQFTHRGTPCKAFWDKVLMRSLLTNLLSNALKYSPDTAPVQLTVHCTDQTAHFTITDSGIGIPEGDRPQIQEAFRRGSNVGAIAGSGLGLAVVKTCVDLHRGTWEIHSIIDQGTTVTVTLPLE